jgi:histidyl-tRNA synthetase
VEKLGPLAEEVFAVLEKGAASERLDTVERGLGYRGLGDYVKRDFTIVRGLAYYTGVVFEVFDRAGEFRAIAAGGRYDDLLKNLGGVDLPALGFGMGDVVLGEMLKAKNLISNASASDGVYVVIADENYRPDAMKMLPSLRIALGRTVHYPFVPMKVGKQLQSAEENGCAYAVIIDAQIEHERVQVKNLATRQQMYFSMHDLGTAFRQLKESPPPS